VALNPGARLGPYEILATLGAGGMGEVYRARDTKLGRDVAVKVLPERLASDADSLARFEREARAVAALNHPNILGIYDFGSHEATFFAVTELLEGETLRVKLEEGAISPRRALDYAGQIARGLAAAHEKGIVHRDLKPDNVFVTRDGRVKILDFGLAKTLTPEDPENTRSPTVSAYTEPGTVMGTVGYMSPEQVKGRPVDHRSDIFSFGAVLFEMITGRRAFKRDTAAETMTAILREEPSDLADSGKNVAPGLDRVIGHCLEKDPELRFQSARDLAFDLEALSGISTSGSADARPAIERGKRPRRRQIAAVALLLAVGAAAFFLGRSSGSRGRSELDFSQLTFRQEPIFNARFAPDGKTILYSAAKSGNTPALYSVRPGFPGATPLGVADAHILSVSSKGEVALLTHARFLRHDVFQGTLARMPLEGGAPREILEDVREADWSPDGADLAIIREVGGKDRLEYPAGKVLCETGGYFSNPRFSPDGGRIAFFEHPIKWDDRGLVAVVDLTGRKKVLSGGYWGEEGLAWSRKSREVLFSAGDAYNNFKIYAVDLSGRRREAVQSAGGVTIQDVASDGRWLVTRDDFLQSMMVRGPGETREQDLSWLEFSDPVAFTADGRRLLFSEESGSVGANYATCMRKTDGSPVVRLGEGFAADLSPDGKWALANVPTTPQRLVLYPTGAGQPRKLDRGALVSYDSARFFPDGGRVLACGHEEGHATRCYVQAVSGGAPRPVTPEGTTDGIVSPDATRVVVQTNTGTLQLFPVGGGAARPVHGTTPGDTAVGWGLDGASLYVFRPEEVPVAVERIDLASGNRTLIRRVGAEQLAGVLQIPSFAMTQDGAAYAYGSRIMRSQLFLVTGAK
jgi:serine/threonine protein kinase